MYQKKTPEYYSDLSLLKFCVFLGIIVNLAIYNENINHSFDIFTKYNTEL